MSKIEMKKKPAAKTVKAWSISRLNTYSQCPLKFKFTALDGLKEPTSPAMERGKAIHTEAELYLKGSTTDLPESLKLLEAEFVDAKAKKAESELEITFTKDWGLTGWFDESAWLRLKVDIMMFDADTIRIIDIKTGKFRANDNDAYEDQLEIYSLAALILYPDVKHISAELWFVDSGDVVGTKHGAYGRDDVERLRKKWEDKATPMFVDTIFAPRPNKYCGFCHFRKGNGGSCEY